MPPGESSSSSHVMSQTVSDTAISAQVPHINNHFNSKSPCRACNLSVPNYKFEKERLRTFDRTWPITFITPKQMSAAGFYFTKEGDVVRCPFCGIEVGSWEPGDDPLDDHKKWSPSCEFVRQLQCGNIPLQETNSVGYDTCGPFGMEIRPFSGPERKCNLNNLENLGVMKTYKCVYPEFCTVEARLKSFESWPISMPQKPKQLAEAGFFYTGMGDKTKCFYCGGGLSRWEPDDDPWMEHARWFSRCGFILIQKGNQFVSRVSGTTQALLTNEAVREIQKEKEGGCTTSTAIPVKQNSSRTPQEREKTGSGSTCETNKSLSSSEGSIDKTKSCESLASSASSVTSMDETKLCKVCYAEERSIVFLPCGHLVCCAKCASSFSQCAVCRQEIKAVVRAFMS